MDERGERTLTSDKEKVEAFGKFFGEVLTTENDEPDGSMVQNPAETRLCDIQITKEAVLKKLKNLKTDKSPGPDQIYPKILKEAAEELVNPLYHLFSKSLQDGKIPELWKMAQVCPIHKKGAKSLYCL
jgi:hypothetical protein